MSSPHRFPTPVEVKGRAACMCAHGHSCTSVAPGHAMHLIQARLIAATPREWIDAIVASVSDGVTVLHTLDGARVEVWSASPIEGARPGAPVAVHARHHALAVGRARVNVAVL
ncbi:hypothetical protein HDC37_001158 [Microbacterium sp. AK009]|uniref:hypothetical protein n=1 Tax=Microbacterium sp. AK009 TaxID=2723068 RepID=UPI0017C731F4|nr:hypothetical protein [Microbacterium sp. AK009]NYF16344.1 hypothetical protein [Microbacterium sp. AK009]